MNINLMQGIYEGTVDVDSLTDEEQEQLLQEYNALAQHWAESPKDGYSKLGKDILLLIEESGLDIADPLDKGTVH